MKDNIIRSGMKTDEYIAGLVTEIGRLRTALRNIVRTETLTTVEQIKGYASITLGVDEQIRTEG